MTPVSWSQLHHHCHSDKGTLPSHRCFRLTWWTPKVTSPRHRCRLHPPDRHGCAITTLVRCYEKLSAPPPMALRMGSWACRRWRAYTDIALTRMVTATYASKFVARLASVVGTSHPGCQEHSRTNKHCCCDPAGDDAAVRQRLTTSSPKRRRRLPHCFFKRHCIYKSIKSAVATNTCSVTRSLKLSNVEPG